ncbi:MAG: immune inhibitor A [Melioribacteraceae bacterium]|nr:immune inhibitor A [Melioribacteraceae bacterium]MCF8356529.1 immune inhibitor A [Melioribacteraceae bacterium]MCF8420974.1 immune inhibitor A [Melioribacteraceae bacterium]
MRRILTVVLLFLLFAVASAQNYKQVKVFLNSKADLKTLADLGLDMEQHFDGKEMTFSMFVDEKEFEQIKSAGFSTEILIDDWFEHYNNRPQMSDAKKAAAIAQSERMYGVSGFGYGSMGGYYTLAEVYQKLDEMHDDYPDLITARDSIGTSIEGRTLYVVKISDNPNMRENEPQVFYNSLIHAREPQGMMTVLYYMFYLLENYGTDPEVTYLVNNREIYFLPVINVDGYEYNRTNSPNGGGMWRKNRRDNSDFSMGVDLNRNWGYQWGYDNSGSSGTPSDETYRGEAPFSEPENQVIREFINTKNFKTALNYHTFSNLLIIPWGYITQETPDSLVFRDFGRDMSAYNGYTWGVSGDIIYEVNGSTDDWMYGEQTEKPKIYSITPEVGGGSDGFWPPQSRIFPLAIENLRPNLYMTWAAGGFVGMENIQLPEGDILQGDTLDIALSLKNKGLGNAYDVSMQLSSPEEFITVVGSTILIDSITSRSTKVLNDSFSVIIDSDVQNGTDAHLVFTTFLGDVPMSNDTVLFTIGTPTVLFEDTSIVITDTWTVNSNQSQVWSTTASDYYTEPFSYTESPTGVYLNDINNKMYLKNNISLEGASDPRLTFWTKWDIESEWDCGQVFISTNSGLSWTPLEGIYTKPGTGSGEQNPIGTPLYDGNQSNWVKESIDLSTFSESDIKLKFEFRSDGWVQGDGWMVDDIQILYYDTTTVNVDEDGINLPREYKLSQNYPNPFNPTTLINYQLPENGFVTLKVYDVLGREVTTLVNREMSAGKYRVELDASKLSTGVYFYQLKTGNFLEIKKMLLLR